MVHPQNPMMNTSKMNQSSNNDHYLSTLLHISITLNSSLELDEVLKNAMELVIQLLKAQRGFIMLLEKGELILKVSKNVDSNQIDSTLKISQTIIQDVFKTGNPVLTVNAMDDERYTNVDSVNLYKLRSVLCVPLTTKENRFGVIYIDNRWKEGIFTERDLGALVTFANTAAIAIDNARLYQNLRDSISEKLRLQQEVYSERTRAEVEKETNKLREQMAHYIIHDLRTPLTIVMSACALLQSKLKTIDATTQQISILEKARINLHRLSRMLNDILDVYLIENGSLTLKALSFDLVETVLAIFRDAEPIKKPDVTFYLKITEKPFLITGDKDLITRVLINIIDNACRWTEQGSITVYSRRHLKKQVAVIDIIDTGTGIPDDLRERIFDRFARLEQKEHPGISKGLGLAFCKMVLDAHGGSIGAIANPSGGTIIRLMIPDNPNPAAEKQPP